jgi:hypothetical protein
MTDAGTVLPRVTECPTANSQTEKLNQVCHINLLKKYYPRENDDSVINPVREPVCSVNPIDKPISENDSHLHAAEPRLRNSQVINNLSDKVRHLAVEQQRDIHELIQDHIRVFGDVPTCTHTIEHDVDIGDTVPIKQNPYRLNPAKRAVMKAEIQSMLDMGIVVPSVSAWSSPCILVSKPDGGVRLCTDYRRVNAVTKSDCYPLPRIEDCIDEIGDAKFVSRYDLLKGYYQIPLTTRAREISAFATPDGFYEYTVTPFGMRNAPATFQRMINTVIQGLDGCRAYIDDVVIFSNTWKEHMERNRIFLTRVGEAHLTINLVKTEFARATVTFLGHIVGQGKVRPVDAKVQAIAEFTRPDGKRSLMRFLGTVGYYRKYCKNFADVVSPLTNLLRKNTKYVWSNECERAFKNVKGLLTNSPVLMAPNFEKPFKLAVDASDVGTGAVLLQEDTQGIEHPICYYSKKLNPHQRNYSTIEKEALALILALQHFEIYLSQANYQIVVLTDHNPLVFVNRMQNKNQRLMRWSLQLQEYNLKIEYIKGKDNIIPDALSRS